MRIHCRQSSFYLFVLLLGLVSQNALAVTSPVIMLNHTANQVIKQLQSNKTDLKKHPKLVYRIVNKTFLPHVDVVGMSRSVLNRTIWLKASATQRQTFTREFTKLVVRTYSRALADYTDEKVRFLPLRGDYQNKRFLSVASVIVRNGAPDIRLSYKLVRKGSQWKVYDMSVEGVSLLQSFRSQFAAQLEQGDFSRLIAQLIAHNKRNH